MAETIREFLVALGFKIDEQGLKKFEGYIEHATGPVLKLGLAAAASATAIEVMVERVARQMEDLYYAAQRSNSTVASLMDIGFAARQIGESAAEGRSALESFGMALRMNPGTEGLLNQFGIQTRDAHGHLEDTMKLYDAWLEKMRAWKEPFFVKAQYTSEYFGIGAAQFYQDLKNLPARLAAEKQLAESQKEMGYNADEAAQKFVDFDRSLNKLEADVEVLGDRIARDLLPVANGLVHVADAIVTAFGRVNVLTHGFLGEITAVSTAVTSTVATLAKLEKLVGGSFFGKLSDLIGKIASSTALRWLLGPAGMYFSMTQPANQGEKDYLRGTTSGEGAPAGAPPGGRLPLGVRTNNPLNMQPGGKEAVFASPLAGLEAAGRLLESYAARGFDTISSIVSRWDAGDTPARLAAYIENVSRGTGYAAGAPLNLSDPAVLSNLERAMARHEQGYQPYDASLYAAAARSVINNYNVSPKTEITVNGSGDPASVGNHVANEQTRVNGDLVRNLSSSVR